MWTDTGHLIAAISFFAFVLFFFALVYWLQREGAREGYPLEEERTGRLKPFLFWPPEPKTFKLAFDQGDVTVPYGRRDTRALAAEATSKVNGSPIEPTGDPLVDGVGPAAWADRAKRPELDSHGHPKIVPMSVATEFQVIKGDAEPRGMSVIAADGRVAGVVSDIWIDRPEALIRYLEVTTNGGRRTLLPISQAVVTKASSLFGGRDAVKVDAITAAQFERAPAIEGAGQVTLYDEERAVAYFGGGYLYATPEREEALL